MGHKITEAIIENGQIKHVTNKLPRGKLKVHLIYDTAEEMTEEIEVKKMVEETSGIYKDIDPGAESRKLRMNWERNARD